MAKISKWNRRKHVIETNIELLRPPGQWVRVSLFSFEIKKVSMFAEGWSVATWGGRWIAPWHKYTKEDALDKIKHWSNGLFLPDGFIDGRSAASGPTGRPRLPLGGSPSVTPTPRGDLSRDYLFIDITLRPGVWPWLA